MDALIPYSIPVKGLRSGIHQFEFHIDGTFFRAFEDSPIEEGNIDLTLHFDKRTDMFVLQFDLKGTVKTACDRCLEEIDLPLCDSQRLLVKFSENPEMEEAEVIYVNPEIQQLNVAKYIYEFICLAMPLIKVYDCENDENRVCNEEMLDYLDGNEETEESGDNPIWAELKKLTKDN